MNKSDELALLKELADKLPPTETYSGAWLREQLVTIEAEMLADIPIGTYSLSVREAARQSKQILENAWEQAKRTSRRAEEHAYKEVEDARRQIAALKERTKDQIIKALS